MKKKLRVAAVYHHNQLAGILLETPSGFSFQYQKAYLVEGRPIAFRFPLREVAFLYDSLPPFFDNLVSEGWLRKIQSCSQHIDEKDHFGLLLRNGRDLIGAVSVLPADEPLQDMSVNYE
ncbi:HipA N-terminal domain-containing protein [Pelagibaculum spongiae]|uniref:HipA N-terminal subdomain 1 domain-containing protein n=1 Tax=Pelagibaculum spongiae TaxID=2080658 RepID=A0A2V1GSZ5_9GAMM|nr:HipA N-terminal domain-containing protein [Pelagibaculum spongiae]PVZ64493.1 hypothetical protein DC094_19460 [Pelagibaculum spongiae]